MGDGIHRDDPPDWLPNHRRKSIAPGACRACSCSARRRVDWVRHIPGQFGDRFVLTGRDGRRSVGNGRHWKSQGPLGTVV
jgi:hypothetical protein